MAQRQWHIIPAIKSLLPTLLLTHPSIQPERSEKEKEKFTVIKTTATIFLKT